MATTSLTQDRLKSLLTYDPDTGEFRWRMRRSRCAPGSIAGTRTTDGYVAVMLSGKKFQSHRLAWFYMTGAWPENEIDHINRNRSDNRWANLREATRLENSRNTDGHANSKSGHKGVAYVSRYNKWQVQMRVRGKTHYIGIYDNVADAISARKNAERQLYAAT